MGRARELELLAAEAAQVGGSGLRAVIVEGEAGIGKTTMLGAFARAVRDEGSAVVVYGRCQDGPAVPLEPFRSLVGHLVEHAPVDVLRAHTTRCGGHLVRLAPRLASRVEVTGVAVSDDATERYLLFEAVSDMLTRLAAISPLVVLLDDIQWAEPTAVQLLRHLGRALVSVPVLLILSARDTDERRTAELRAVLAGLECRPGRRIRLGGFDEGELAGLTASLLAVDATAVASAVPARLRNQTAGNPLYATQLARHWAESGRLTLAAAEVGCGATAIVAQAALATDRGFLRLGPAAPAQVAIVQSALEVVDADPATRARLLALLAENLVSDVAGTRRTGLAREAIALADASPDRTLLARICSSVLYALWGPDREATWLRADVAERSIAAAAAAGDLPVEFGVHAAAYTVAIQLADPAGAARSLGRLHAIADQIGAPHMTWTVGWYEAFVATMQARFADADRLGRQTVELGLAIGAADGVALFAGQAAVLATIAGHHPELPPIVAEAIGAGPVQLTFYLAHAIVSVASGPREVASDLLGEAAAAGFRNVPPDLMWMTSMLGYAILAIELEDLGAAAQLFAIIGPYAGEVATNLGPVAAYAGRLASLLGRHDVADQHLNAALEIAGAFDWDYHRAAILIARAAARHRPLGRLDGPARVWLATAEGICAAHGLPGMLAMIGALRA